jgi:hypothetical protein
MEKEWKPIQGEMVWIKVFSNWSMGTYLVYDTTRNKHLVREDYEGGYILSSDDILPYDSMPNLPRPKPFEDAAKNFIENEMKFSFNSLETKTHANRMLKCVEFGAKWQAERMYSEEEVLNLIQEAVYKKQNAWKTGELEGWFETNKKKI